MHISNAAGNARPPAACAPYASAESYSLTYVPLPRCRRRRWNPRSQTAARPTSTSGACGDVARRASLRPGSAGV